MSFGLYNATVAPMLQILPPVRELFAKASAHCAKTGRDEADLCDASLAPDMWPLAKQATTVCTFSIRAVQAALTGKFEFDPAPPPQNFDVLAARIDAAIEGLQAVTPEALNARMGQDVLLEVGEHRLEFLAEDFLMTFVLPNFFFHSTTIYDILRNQGLELTKRDYTGGMKTKG